MAAFSWRCSPNYPAWTPRHAGAHPPRRLNSVFGKCNHNRIAAQAPRRIVVADPVPSTRREKKRADHRSQHPRTAPTLASEMGKRPGANGVCPEELRSRAAYGKEVEVRGLQDSHS